MRQEITTDETMIDVLLKLSEGNPGAARVLADLVCKDNSYFVSIGFGLDDMNIRGSQIWVAYKEFSGENLDTLIKHVAERNQDMVDFLNQPQWGFTEKAMRGGASFKRY